ncbi:hypothetical protein Gohar_019633 [Gossypium harknessii]|nr:hypothetical protein [Gossypium harknessii]
MPLSPTVHGSQQTPFGLGHNLGSSIQLTESSLYPSTSSVSHSYSSSSLGQMQFDNSSVGSFWSPHRSQMRLQNATSKYRIDVKRDECRQNNDEMIGPDWCCADLLFNLSLLYLLEFDIAQPIPEASSVITQTQLD